MTETSDTSSELKWTIHFAIVISYKRRCREVDSFEEAETQSKHLTLIPSPRERKENELNPGHRPLNFLRELTRGRQSKVRRSQTAATGHVPQGRRSCGPTAADAMIGARAQILSRRSAVLQLGEDETPGRGLQRTRNDNSRRFP